MKVKSPVGGVRRELAGSTSSLWSRSLSIFKKALMPLPICAAVVLFTALALSRNAFWGIHAQDLEEFAYVPDDAEAPSEDKTEWIEQISWHPRAYIYHNFLTYDETDALVAMAKPKMKRSSVVSSEGKPGIDEIRTSYGMFLKRLNGTLITQIERKLEDWTRLPLVNQEDMQILRYGQGQKYGAHYDSLSDESPRIATALFYLKDENLTGGETAFPVESEWIGGSHSTESQFSDCAKGHVAALPRRGDALLFYSLEADGKSDVHSMHTGCPVVTGVKWTATKWIHTKPFRPESLDDPLLEDSFRLPDACEDYHEFCKDWADAGECKNNPAFMSGGDGQEGAGRCRLSCGSCEVCEDDDIPCINRNRAKLFYLPLDAP